jgi:hypothetical protein
MRQATVTTLAEDSPSLLGRGLGAGPWATRTPPPNPLPKGEGE